MKYFCIKRNEIVSEEKYQRCLECTDPTSKFYSSIHDSSLHGCATQRIVGYQNDDDFEINMTKLIREKKLKRL